MTGRIPLTELTTLKPASEVKTISAGAPLSQELDAVAYAINTAANTGEYRAVFIGDLRSETIQLLESNGYTVARDSTSVHPQYVILWA